MARGRIFNTHAFRLGLVCAGLIADQASKHWARVRFSGPGGYPDPFKVLDVAGAWLRFRLVYNTGAAFGMRPQALLPFLGPTVFYTFISVVAMVVLAYYYRKLPEREGWARAAAALILSGACGNLIDRLRFHQVTDFIDAGIPSLPTRWPTFNLADSWVCIGVGILVLAPLFQGKGRPEPSAMPAEGRAEGERTGA